jgi:hypothetical protein
MENTVTFDNDSNSYIFSCPNCGDMIQVLSNEIACGIFRHAYYKNNNEQLPPHASFEECEQLRINNMIYGCGKPFILKINNGACNVSICDYI